MSNRAERREYQRVAGGPASVWRNRPAVNAMSADALWRELVEDAKNYIDTPVNRMIPAINRIAVLRHLSVEDTTKQFLQACKEARGDTRMPGTDPNYRTGV